MTFNIGQPVRVPSGQTGIVISVWGDPTLYTVAIAGCGQRLDFPASELKAITDPPDFQAMLDRIERLERVVDEFTGCCPPWQDDRQAAHSEAAAKIAALERTIDLLHEKLANAYANCPMDIAGCCPHVITEEPCSRSPSDTAKPTT